MLNNDVIEWIKGYRISLIKKMNRRKYLLEAAPNQMCLQLRNSRSNEWGHLGTDDEL